MTAVIIDRLAAAKKFALAIPKALSLISQRAMNMFRINLSENTVSKPESSPNLATKSSDLAKKNLASCIFIAVYLNFLGSQQKVWRHKHSLRAPKNFKFKNDKVRSESKEAPDCSPGDTHLT
jgi:hypothetical protein